MLFLFLCIDITELSMTLQHVYRIIYFSRYEISLRDSPPTDPIESLAF